MSAVALAKAERAGDRRDGSPGATGGGPAEPRDTLYGLVLIGGRSRRMRADKALLRYGGRRQFERAFNLLTAHCRDVFLSVRPDQTGASPYRRFARIPDAYGNLGPLGGILSALRARPRAGWLVLACDLPFLDNATLRHLVRRRRRRQIATAFRSAHDGLPEPLCAIYEPRSRRALEAMVARGVTCPRKALLLARVPLLDPVNPRALDNVNSPREYQEARSALGRG